MHLQISKNFLLKVEAELFPGLMLPSPLLAMRKRSQPTLGAL
jgi:hypothetical protein